MITVFNISLVSKVCPENMTETDCPLRDFMKKQNVFRPTVNNSLFELTKPYPQIREEYIRTLDTVHEICANCKGQR